jgi:filamentous hemagglutinin family protein
MPARFRDALLVTTCLVAASSVALGQNLPTGGTVTAGQGTISNPNAHTTLVKQNSDRVGIDWTTFNVGKGNSVIFNQPGSSSIALNRVKGGPSTINGSLTANGQVWFINPSGMLFGQGVQVNVGGIVASTAGMSNADFMSGRTVFDIPGNPGAAIVNEGTIRAAQGGYAVLAGERVDNRGVIEAELGSVVLAGVKTYALDFHGDRLLRFEVKGAVEGGEGPLVSNSGRISADGGRVVLTAAAARNVVDNVINTSGIIEAKSAQLVNGEIVLMGEGGGVEVSGRLDVSGQTENRTGGKIEVLGDTVRLLATANVDASGDAGGGRIQIGGHYDGKLASKTTLEAGSRVAADALGDGKGGHIEIWSKDQTIAAGRITARGGALGGDGGFIETSSVGTLGITPTAQISAAAPKGNAGSWLLDPNNIRIVNLATSPDVTVTTGGGITSITSNSQAADSIVDVNTIVNALNQGTSVTVQTKSCACLPNTGDITLDAAITTDTGVGLAALGPEFGGIVGNVTLTLSASNNVTINKSIMATQGKLNVVLNGSSSTGTITVNDTILTGAGGSFNSSAKNFVQTNGLIGTNGGNATFSGQSFTQSGGAIATGTGSISTSLGSAFTQSAGLLETSTGSISINANTVQTAGNINSVGGSISINASTSVTQTGGAIATQTGSFTATTGTFNQAAGSIATGAGNFTLNANTIAALNSVSGSGIAQVAARGFNTIGVGTGAGNLRITQAIINELADFSELRLGSASNNTLTVGGVVTLPQKTRFDSGNQVVLDSTAMLSTVDGGETVTFGRFTSLGGVLRTRGGEIVFEQGAGLAANAIVDTTNGGEISAGANVTFNNSVNGSFRDLTINAGNSDIFFNGNGSFALVNIDDLTTSSRDLTISDNLFSVLRFKHDGTGTFKMTGAVDGLANSGEITVTSPTILIDGLNQSFTTASFTASSSFTVASSAILKAEKLTVTSDSIEIAGSATVAGLNANTSTALLRPLTETTVAVGNAAGAFSLDATELGRFSNFRLVAIGGDTVTSANVGGAISLTTNLTVQALAAGGVTTLNADAAITGNNFLFGLEAKDTVTQTAGATVAMGPGGTLLLGADSTINIIGNTTLTGQHVILRGATDASDVSLEDSTTGVIKLTQADHVGKLGSFAAIAIGDPRFGSGDVFVGGDNAITTAGSISFGGGAGDSDVFVGGTANITAGTLATDYVAFLAGPTGSVTVATGAQIDSGAASVIAAGQTFNIDGDFTHDPGATVFLTSGGLGTGTIGVGDTGGVVVATQLDQAFLDDATDTLDGGFAKLAIGDLPTLLNALRPGNVSTGVISVGNVSFAKADVTFASTGGDIRLLPGRIVMTTDKSVTFKTHATLVGNGGSSLFAIHTDGGGAGGDVSLLGGFDGDFFGNQDLSIIGGDGIVMLEGSSFLPGTLTIDAANVTLGASLNFSGFAADLSATSTVLVKSGASFFADTVDVTAATLTQQTGAFLGGLDVTLNASSSAALNGNLNFDNTLTISGGAVTVSGNITPFSSFGFLEIDVASLTQTGGIIQGSTVDIDTPSFTQTAGTVFANDALVISTDSIQLGGSVQGFGTAVLRPKTGTAISIATSSGGAVFDIDNAELAKIQGFASLTIGSMSTTSINIGNATFQIATRVLANPASGTITFDANSSSTAVTTVSSLEFNAATVAIGTEANFDFKNANVLIKADQITDSSTGTRTGLGTLTLVGQTKTTIDVGKAGSGLFLSQDLLDDLVFGAVVIGDLGTTEFVNISSVGTTLTLNSNTAFVARQKIALEHDQTLAADDLSLAFITNAGGEVFFGDNSVVNPNAGNLVFATDKITFGTGFTSNLTGGELVVAPGIGSAQFVSLGTLGAGTLKAEEVVAKFGGLGQLSVGLDTDFVAQQFGGDLSFLPRTQNVEIGGTNSYNHGVEFHVDLNPGTGQIVLASNTGITTTGAGNNIEFFGTIQGRNGGESLTLDAGANMIGLNSAGTITPLGAISLTAGGGINLGFITDSLIVTQGQSMTFNGPVTIGNGGFTSVSLLTNGNGQPGATVEFKNTVTGVNGIGFLDVDTGTAKTILNDDVTGLSGFAAGNVTFMKSLGKIIADDFVSIGDVDGTLTDLMLAANSISVGSVGASTPLTSIDVSGQVIDLTGTKYITTGSQSYSTDGGVVRVLAAAQMQADSVLVDGQLQLFNDLTIATTGASGVTVGGGVGGGGMGDLTITAQQVTIQNDFSSFNRIGSIDVTADTISVSGVDTFGNQTYRALAGATTINGFFSSNGGNFLFTGTNVTGSSFTQINSNGGFINLGGVAIDGPFDLQLNTGALGFAVVGNVGQTSPLQSFTLSGNGSVGAVKTTFTQTYNGNTVFNGTLESSLGNINFQNGSGSFASGSGKVMPGSSGNIVQVSGNYTIDAVAGQVLEFGRNTNFSAGSNGTINVNAPLGVTGNVSLLSGRVNMNNSFLSTGTLSTSGNGNYTFNSVAAIGGNVLLNNFGGSVTFNGTLFGNQLTALQSAPVSIRNGAVFVGDICIGNLNTIGGTIATSGDLIVGGKINLASDTVVVVNGTVDADPTSVTLNGNTLTVVGSVEFDPAQLNLDGIVITADAPNRTVVFSPAGAAPVVNEPPPPPPVLEEVVEEVLDTQTISSLIDQTQVRIDGAGSALGGLVASAFGAGDVGGGTETSDTGSSEASSFASVFDSGSEGGDSGGGQQGSQQQGGSGGPPQGQSKPKQVEAPPVSSVTPVLGGIVGRVVNSSYQGAAGVPGLGANASSGTGSAMP